MTEPALTNSEGYIAQIGRRYGCPEMWISDLVQDVEVYRWQHPGISKTKIARKVIDLIREHYGPYSRTRRWRSGAPLETAYAMEQADFTDTVDHCIDFQIAWWRLTPTQRWHFGRYMAAGHAVGVHQTRISQIRRKLRELVA